MKKVIIGLFILGTGFIVRGILQDPSLNMPPETLALSSRKLTTYSPAFNGSKSSIPASVIGFMAHEAIAGHFKAKKS